MGEEEEKERGNILALKRSISSFHSPALHFYTHPLNAVSLDFLESYEVGEKLRDSYDDVDALLRSEAFRDADAIFVGEKRNDGEFMRKIADST